MTSFLLFESLRREIPGRQMQRLSGIAAIAHWRGLTNKVPLRGLLIPILCDVALYCPAPSARYANRLEAWSYTNKAHLRGLIRCIFIEKSY